MVKRWLMISVLIALIVAANIVCIRNGMIVAGALGSAWPIIAIVFIWKDRKRVKVNGK